jgi:PHD/YefM family antitoxin component YafN of YafNO toxin-antitoxin module
MAKSNAELQKDKRAKEKALLDRVGAEKRSLIVSKALDDALNILGERHDFEEWQETVSTFLINLAAAPTDESIRFASMSRPEIIITEKQSRQLERFAKTGVEA